MRKDLIINWLEKNGQTLTDTQLCHMEIYQNMVLSAPMNLTAIKDDEGFAIKHFIDSLTLLPWIDALTNNAKVIDIGTGAGFPGVPLKIARPNLDITLLDSLQKRVLFLRKALDELGYADVETVHARVEDYVKNVGEMYDIAVARAVARLEKLADYALPLVKPGGLFLAMKGPNIEEEIKNAKPVLHKLGGEIINISAVEISQEMFHTIIAIQKK
ncbi:MAG: 16S rRNA (guanine(527)-N(7))-methyltransferase RsmG [Defluviitaleaceae bacterium]|nr:16S rRNA (guanine(527)-N(7))-methyltransferase RsmG [Defluviitaleaceae bacterium]